MVCSKIQERDELKELLNKKGAELEALKNPQPIHTAKNEYILKRTPRVWLNNHLIKRLWV